MPMVIDSTIHKEIEGSDHCPIQLKIKLEAEQKKGAGEEKKKSKKDNEDDGGESDDEP
jgi:hypothetical protein